MTNKGLRDHRVHMLTCNEQVVAPGTQPGVQVRCCGTSPVMQCNTTSRGFCALVQHTTCAKEALMAVRCWYNCCKQWRLAAAVHGLTWQNAWVTLGHAQQPCGSTHQTHTRLQGLPPSPPNTVPLRRWSGETKRRHKVPQNHPYTGHDTYELGCRRIQWAYKRPCSLHHIT
jgi:hypothetical protein